MHRFAKVDGKPKSIGRNNEVKAIIDREPGGVLESSTNQTDTTATSHDQNTVVRDRG